MADKSKIEWTDATWTPIRAMIATPYGPKLGWHCEQVSEGCRNCYAERLNLRLGTGLEFKPGNVKHKNANGDDRGDVSLFLDEKMLLAPLRWKRPRQVFVCSMTDLFADFVLDEWIDRVFAVMALAPQHTYICLTKRSQRMREYVNNPRTPQRVASQILSFCANSVITGPQALAPLGVRARESDPSCVRWPLPNVWKGVSAERQQEADERIPDLLATPAVVRFVSAEPLLGPIDFEEAWNGHYALGGECWGDCRWCQDGHPPMHNCQRGKQTEEVFNKGRSGLDWIIVGGESGPGARPMQVEWARSIVEQCRSASVACFVKQLGADPTWSDGAFLNLRDRKGGDMSEWPTDLRVRDLPREIVNARP